MIKSVVFGGGKGFGESILLQYGNNDYGIIDSFIDQKSRNPIVLDYLLQKNIDYDEVKFIVLTHYHQDHFTGIGTILEKCINAKFYTSSTIISESFSFLLAACSSINSTFNFFSEFDRIIKIIRDSGRKMLVLSDKSPPIIDTSLIKIYSLSPNDNTVKFLDNIYKERAQKLIKDKGIKLQIGKDFNFQSVVIGAEIGKIKILFGSDLEYSPNDSTIGWSAICKSKKLLGKQFNIFKLPHHGSENGCNIQDWTKLMVVNGYLKLTPFSKSRLPRPEMVKKICNLSSNSFITSEIKTGKIPSPLRKKLKGLNIRLIKDSKGYIELTASIQSNKINVVLKGEAKKLS